MVNRQGDYQNSSLLFTFKKNKSIEKSNNKVKPMSQYYSMPSANEVINYNSHYCY
jgi:hypothetical protein